VPTSPELKSLSRALGARLSTYAIEVGFEAKKSHEDLRLLAQENCRGIRELRVEFDELSSRTATDTEEAESRDKLAVILNSAYALSVNFEIAVSRFGKSDFSDEYNKVVKQFRTISESLRTKFPRSVTQDHKVGDLEQAVVVADLAQYTLRVQALRGVAEAFGNAEVLDSVFNLDRRISLHIQHGTAIAAPSDDLAGHLIRSTGDGAILRFDTISEAIQFTAALHTKARTYSAQKGLEKPFLYRVGIAFGLIRVPLRFRDGSTLSQIAGIPLITAARMESCSEPGGVCLDIAAFERWETEGDIRLNVKNKYDSELQRKFICHPEKPVKNGEKYNVLMLPKAGWPKSGPS